MTTRARTAHTADLAPAELGAVRALLDAAFDGDFGDDDWDHGLGGMHEDVHAAGCGTAAGGCAPGTSRTSPYAPTPDAPASAGRSWRSWNA
jgi:hypothetical protein